MVFKGCTTLFAILKNLNLFTRFTLGQLSHLVRCVKTTSQLKWIRYSEIVMNNTDWLR